MLLEHRRVPAALSDLVSWAFMVDDGIVLQKDGAFLAGWRYRGPDLLAASPSELTALSRHINDILLPFGDHWMFHLDAVRHPAAGYAASTFPNAVTALIDAERRAAYDDAGSHFETEHVICVTHLPPAQVYTRAAQWFVRGQGQEQLGWEHHLRAFNVACAALADRLSSRLTIERLSADALLGHLHRCVSGLDHPVRTPPVTSAYLDGFLAAHDFVGGFHPVVGTQHIRVVAIDGYPSAVPMGALDALHRLPCAFRWSNRVIPLGTHTAQKLIRRHQLTWFKKRKGAGEWLQELAAKNAQPARSDDTLFRDQNAQAMAEDAAVALAESASGDVRFCVFNQIVVVMEASSAASDRVAGIVIKVLHDHGFMARLETVNAVEAFLGTLPGHGSPNVRRPLLHSANIANLVPVTTVWPGLAENPSPYFPSHSPPLLWAKTDGTTPFRLNLHDADVGHTLLVGRTGAGKSTLVGLITAQFQRYPAAQVFVFDVGYSAWLLAQAAGACHYDIASGTPDTLTFQPLANISDPTERLWATEWIELLVSLQGTAVTPQHRARIARALALLAENAPQYRTLTECAVHLQDAELVSALRPYTAEGQYGRLLDADDDALRDGRYQVFELKQLMELDDKILVPTLLYLFHRIEQRLDGAPTLIVIEELWAPLMRSIFADRIRQWLLTLRKQNAAVLLVAHSVSQLESIPNAQLLIESCPTRIFLPNAEAQSGHNAPLYRDLGLNEQEIQTLVRGVPKRDYYIKSRQGSRLFELGLGPVARAFLTTPDGMTAEEARRTARTFMDRYGAAWPAAWLRMLGLDSWAERYPSFDPAVRGIHSNG